MPFLVRYVLSPTSGQLVDPAGALEVAVAVAVAFVGAELDEAVLEGFVS